MGNTSSPCACTHARQSCAGVQPFVAVKYLRHETQATHARAGNTPAIFASGSAHAAMLAEKFSALKRGLALLLSVAGSAAGFTAPVSSPRHSGEYATMPMPSSRAHGMTGVEVRGGTGLGLRRELLTDLHPPRRACRCSTLIEQQRPGRWRGSA